MVQSVPLARSIQGTKRSRNPHPPVSPRATAAKRRKTVEPALPNGHSSGGAVKREPCRRSAREATVRQTAAADLTAATRQQSNSAVPQPSEVSQQQLSQQQQPQQPAAGVRAEATAAEQHSAEKVRKRGKQTPLSVTPDEAAPSATADTTNSEQRATQHQTDQDNRPSQPGLPAVAQHTDAEHAEQSASQGSASNSEVSLQPAGSDHNHASSPDQQAGAQTERQVSTAAAAAAAAAGDAATQPPAAAAGHKKRVRGVPHHTLRGVVTTTEGVRGQHAVSQVKQLWSGFVTITKSRRSRPARRYLGRFYHSPEAAARAVDRATIALHGRDSADTNFPQQWYGPEEQQRYGADLERWLRTLAGRKNNNPKDAPGVPYVKPLDAFLDWQKAQLEGFRAARIAKAQKGKAVATAASEPVVDPTVGWRLWQMLTGASSSQARPEGQHGGGHWHNTPCGHCMHCKQAAWKTSSSGCSQCLALPKLRVARRELTRLAEDSSQQRFDPADLHQFIASLPEPSQEDLKPRPTPDLQRDNGDDTLTVAGKGPELVTKHGQGFKSRAKARKQSSSIADVSAMPGESQGGTRRKGVRQGVSDSNTGPAKKAEDNQAEHSVSWTREQALAMQTGEQDLYRAQEQGRVLAAGTAPSQGCYQPLLAHSDAPGLDKHKWPDHHMVDLRHIQRCAREGSLVEVRNHDRWRAPALGTLGPPADALQGSLGSKSDQEEKPAHITHCCLCKAHDHLVSDCPLNMYYGEAPSAALQPEDKPSGPKAGRASRQCQQAAAVDWLGAVQQPVKEVMSAMQQLASAAVHVNEQKDSRHSDVVESMTPDALLACGLLVDELMRSQIEHARQPNR